MKKATSIILAGLFCLTMSDAYCQKTGDLPFMNQSLPTEERVNDLVSRMTLKEKADQLLYTAPAIRVSASPITTGGTNHCTALHGLVMLLSFRSQ